MKLQALLSTQKVALHAWGSLSFFFFSFFLKQLYKNIANNMINSVQKKTLTYLRASFATAQLQLLAQVRCPPSSAGSLDIVPPLLSC
jgi:hypothetical protein